MVKYAEPRFERRLRARREARRLAEVLAEELAKQPKPSEERRVRSMTPAQVEAWLKQTNIPKQRTRRR